MSGDVPAVEAHIRDAIADARWADATTAALTTYGDEVLGYLTALARNETDASDAFALFAEELWKSLPKFRGECSVRTWAYRLARHAFSRVRRDPHRRRAVPIDDVHVAALVADLRSRTATFLRTETKDKIAKLRAELAPDDQTMLILRINRGLGWREIARILADDAELSTAALDKQAAALRKRFERLKADLKERAKVE